VRSNQTDSPSWNTCGHGARRDPKIPALVPADDIDERYLDKPYYIVPNGKAGADAFAVIRDAMKRKDKVALARVVL
jgi:non-homologous end joining protein Ku